ncbi:DNA-binding protein [Escherichia coli]|nr:DNA-binding protein [Escherichia coli]EEW2469463.1 DNA-binding protein [Escherichia coli]EGI4643086.1 helix-turn-helix domain-containing protein [Escherichia coli]MGR07689.1 DNA-binding protein [Escherichia coli]MHT42195.1 DNA-binding protein [Escherichia coli]
MNELAEIKQMLAKVMKENGKPTISVSEKEFLTVEECAELIGAKKSYIYRLTHEKRLPYHKPGGNRILIRQDDVVAWMESNRIKSQQEIDSEVANHLIGRKRVMRPSH